VELHSCWRVVAVVLTRNAPSDGILRLCSGEIAALAGANTQLQIVQTTCPAHHSDQRYAPSLCLGGLRRLRAVAKTGRSTVTVRGLLQRLDTAEVGWEEMAAAASSANPEPWLPAGVSGVAWQ